MNRQPSGYEPDELPTAPSRVIMVEGEGFEPSKASLTDLQSAPFSLLGIPPGFREAEHRADSANNILSRTPNKVKG